MRPHLGHKLRHWTRFHQRRPHRIAHKIMQHALLPEPHLGFRRMHIHIHLGCRQLQKQQHHGIHRRRNNISIRLGQRMLNQTVANRPPVHEHENRIAVQFLNFRLRNEAVNAHLARLGRENLFSIFASFFPPPGRRLRQSHPLQRLPRSHGNQLVERFLAEYLIHALAVSRYRRRDQHGIGRRMQLEMFVGMGQRIVCDQRGNVRQLGRLRLQEFLPRRSIEEKIAHGNRRSLWQPGFFDPRNLPAVYFDHRPRVVLRHILLILCRFRPRFQPQARHRRDRRQRLAAKSQRGDAQQVFGVLDLRRRMPFKRQHGVVAHHAAAVVGNLDQLLSAGLDADLDSRRARVQRVLQHLLHHGRRPLHHLACGDLVGDGFGEYVDAAHGEVLSSQFSVLSFPREISGQFRRWEEGRQRRNMPAI